MGGKLEKEVMAHVMLFGSGLVFVVRNPGGISRQTVGTSSEMGFWCFGGRDGGADLGPNRYHDFSLRSPCRILSQSSLPLWCQGLGEEMTDLGLGSPCVAVQAVVGWKRLTVGPSLVSEAPLTWGIRPRSLGFC